MLASKIPNFLEVYCGLFAESFQYEMIDDRNLFEIGEHNIYVDFDFNNTEVCVCERERERERERVCVTLSQCQQRIFLGDLL